MQKREIFIFEICKILNFWGVKNMRAAPLPVDPDHDRAPENDFQLSALARGHRWWFRADAKRSFDGLFVSVVFGLVTPPT